MANVLQQFAPDAAQFLSTSFPALNKGGTNFPAVGLAFDATAAENAFWMFRAINYASGNLTLNIDWYAASATSGDVVWSNSYATTDPSINGCGDGAYPVCESANTSKPACASAAMKL